MDDTDGVLEDGPDFGAGEAGRAGEEHDNVFGGVRGEEVSPGGDVEGADG